MRRSFLAFVLFCVTAVSAMAAGRAVDNRFINKNLYTNIYPSTLNNNVEKAALDAQTNTKNAANQTKKAEQNDTKTTTNKSDNRKVIKRPNKTRPNNTASLQRTARRVAPRAATSARPTSNTNTIQNSTNNTSNRRVVLRNVSSNRSSYNNTSRNTTTTSSTQSHMTSQQCFAGYKECMDSYCERTDTPYNRCYCSARLAQIDSKYQPKIDSLIQDIIKLKYNTNATDAEIKSYWDATVGTYTKTNPWVNIDNALNIDWASTESRVRGQNAFASGHSYCSGHLRACSYMASNLRDAYKSEIERDCSTYEKSLNRIQTAAESVVESFNK